MRYNTVLYIDNDHAFGELLTLYIQPFDATHGNGSIRV